MGLFVHHRCALLTLLLARRPRLPPPQVLKGEASPDVLDEDADWEDVETELLMPDDMDDLEAEAADFDDDDENWQERIIELTRVTKVGEGWLGALWGEGWAGTGCGRQGTAAARGWVWWRRARVARVRPAGGGGVGAGDYGAVQGRAERGRYTELNGMRGRRGWSKECTCRQRLTFCCRCASVLLRSSYRW